MECLGMQFYTYMLLLVCVLMSSWSVSTAVSDNGGTEHYVYDRTVLFDIKNIMDQSKDMYDSSSFIGSIPLEIRKGKQRRRGRKGGVRARWRRRQYRTAMPSVIMGNVRSLRNKIDELEALTRYDYQYRECCYMCFSETWLSECDTDNSVSISGFNIVRGDRTDASQKSRGGGVCMYINERYCKNISLKEHYCDENIELIVVALRPFYMPREFNQQFVVTTYIPPSSNYNLASNKLVEIINNIEDTSPDAVIMISGDFNQCTTENCLINYQQYVDLPTRGDRTLDLFFSNIKNAYKVNKLIPLGASDHDILHMIPKYKQCLKTKKATNLQIKDWNVDNIEMLRACYDITDWNVMLDEDLNVCVDVITDYLKFCEDSIIPIRSVKLYPNNKPWVSKELKEMLNIKKRCIASKDVDGRKLIQKTLNKKVRECKMQYKNKIEDMFKSNNTKAAWKGLKTLTGYKSSSCLPEHDNNRMFAEELNIFYNRFDVHNFSTELTQMELSLADNTDQQIIISQEEVRNTLKNINPRKACGPDGITGKLLKECKDQLAPILTIIYQKSMDSHIIPNKWLTAQICPVPKVKFPVTKNDLRPVSLTSVVMKTFERIVIKQLKLIVPSDRFQFAYSAGKSVEDATLTLLHFLYKHTDTPGNVARVLYVDFSSAFNTIQPLVLIRKLINMNINCNLILWVKSFLTGRYQYVRFKDSTSSIIQTNTGSPQGCVLSALLFILYTYDCQSQYDKCITLKYADDTVIIGLLDKRTLEADNSLYVNNINWFHDWCKQNFLDLNVKKTKEMIIKFGKAAFNEPKVYIDVECVDTVSEYKYLGSIIDDKLKFHANSLRICKKSNQRLYFLRKLRILHVDNSILTLFFNSVIQSVLSFCIVCWYGSLTKNDSKMLDSVLKKARKLGCINVKFLSELHAVNMERKIKHVLEDANHPLHNLFVTLPSGCRLQALSCKTNRLLNSFVPSAIRMYNEKCRR